MPFLNLSFTDTKPCQLTRQNLKHFLHQTPHDFYCVYEMVKIYTEIKWDSDITVSPTYSKIIILVVGECAVGKTIVGYIYSVVSFVTLFTNFLSFYNKEHICIIRLLWISGCKIIGRWPVIKEIEMSWPVC